MSKDSEVKTEAKVKMEERLESALQRVVAREKQRLVPQLELMCTLASQKEQVLAALIHARKERQCPPGDAGDGQGPSPDSQEGQLHIDIDDRQTALINHRIVKDALQTAAFNIQLQEAVRNGLQKVDVDETMDNLTERGVLLAHCSSSLHSYKELAIVEEQMANLNKEILHLHTKYSSILKKIRPKWEALQDKFMQVGEENKVLIQMRDKARDREGKIQLLVVMIQGLVSACGFQWGAYEYFVQVMQLCDAAVMHQDTARQNAIINQISKIHEERENIGSRSTLREMLSASKP
ncbi:hypothetical protein O3P69_008907 [Scylla paramamosain]|uniref:Uncharacterized protein n=2 Tax=Scylla paramamosain TaxID=85552 RepID=A0AAW0TT71_SCYPA